MPISAPDALDWLIIWTKRPQNRTLQPPQPTASPQVPKRSLEGKAMAYMIFRMVAWRNAAGLKSRGLNMRASLQAVASALKPSQVPKTIRQEPFDHDPGHYRMFCHLNGTQPACIDLYDYALDLKFMELQPDLLRHLMPVMLEAWRKDLFESDAAGYAGFVEEIWAALLRGSALRTCLSGADGEVAMRFMRDTILDRLDAEDSLGFAGSRASPHRWVHALGAFGLVFPEVEPLWTEWWQMKTLGHAVPAFQYAPALLYAEDKNPVFAPWTREKGGGPPCLWEHGCMIFDAGWREENIQFVRQTFSVEYFENRLRAAQNVIQNADARSVASRIPTEFPAQSTLLGLRLEQLPDLLSKMDGSEEFTI